MCPRECPESSIIPFLRAADRLRARDYCSKVLKKKELHGKNFMDAISHRHKNSNWVRGSRSFYYGNMVPLFNYHKCLLLWGDIFNQAAKTAFIWVFMRYAIYKVTAISSMYLLHSLSQCLSCLGLKYNTCVWWKRYNTTTPFLAVFSL